MPFDTFTGSTVQPSDVSYRAVALSADVTLVWPSTSQTSSDVVARIMNVTPSGGGLSITMPDATQRSTGQDALIRNLGANSFTVKANDGSTIGTVAAGEAKYIYLVVNTTPAGSWSVITFGTGTSSADASALAGMGLLAVGSTLNQKHDVAEITNNLTIGSADRAKTYVWTSGSYTLTLPTASSVGSNFFFIAKNAGAGTISTAISGADTVDTSALAPGESAIFYSNGAGPGAWYSVGQGRNVAFSFTQLVKSVAGGVDVTLSSAEAANKVMSFTGVLTANINVIVPNTVSVYYVYNNTSGAFTLTVKTAAGSGIGVAQGTRDILVCDATNVLQAMSNTVVSTIFNVGSESLPSITFLGDTDSGFYDKAANQPAVTAGGTDAMRWNTVASAVNAIDVFPAVTTAAPYLVPFGGDANVSLGLRPLGSGTGVILQDSAGASVLTALAGSVTAAQRFLGINGTAGAPTYGFSNDLDVGMFYTATRIGFAVDGTEIMGVISGNFVSVGSASFGWGATVAAPDALLTRDAADTIAQRRTTNAQTFRIYNTFTDAGNYERGSLEWSSNVFRLRSDAAGSGTVRSMQIGILSSSGSAILSWYTNGTERWKIDANGHLIGATDNTYDVGASGATRPRTGYFGTSVIIGTDPGGSELLRVGGVPRFKLADATYVFVQTASNPSAASGSGGYAIYANDGTFLSYVRRAGGSGELFQVSAAHSSITGMQIGGAAIGSLANGIQFQTDNTLTQFSVTHTASANRFVQITGSNGGNPTITTSAGSLAITPAVVLASTLSANTTGNIVAPTFESAETAVTGAGTDVTVAHGLGAVPRQIYLCIRCKTAEFGYSIGDEVGIGVSSGSTSGAQSVWADATNIGISLQSGASITICRRDTHATATITLANWKYVFRAMK